MSASDSYAATPPLPSSGRENELSLRELAERGGQVVSVPDAEGVIDQVKGVCHTYYLLPEINLTWR